MLYRRSQYQNEEEAKKKEREKRRRKDRTGKDAWIKAKVGWWGKNCNNNERDQKQEEKGVQTNEKE